MRLIFIGVLSLAANGSLAAPDGGQRYATHCAVCHGDKGTGGVGVPLALPSFLVWKKVGCPGFLLALLALRFSLTANAEQILMTRSLQPFPKAMFTPRESIRTHPDTVSRVQGVDSGLTGLGYKTDKYRIAFLGKIEEIREVGWIAPRMMPCLPLKIFIFAADGSTVVVTSRPRLYAAIAGDGVDPVIFERRESDRCSIFHDVSQSG